MFVLLYKELEIALTINSHYSKHALMNKCPENIKVCRMSAYGKWERSGSVVECLTRDRRAAGSSLTGVTALWSLSKTHLP